MKKLIVILILSLSITVNGANTKTTGLTELTAVADADIMYIVDDAAGTPTSKKITVVNVFDTINTFAKLNTIVADKTLVNEEDTITWDSVITFSDAITLSDGATIDQSANNYVTFAENGDTVAWYFDGTNIDLIWSDGVLNIRNSEDGIDGIVEIEGKDAGEKGVLRVLSDGFDKYIELHNDDTDAVITNSVGNIIINPVGLSVVIGDNGDEDYTITFDGDTSNGILNYDEDNADFEFDQDLSATAITAAGIITGNLGMEIKNGAVAAGFISIYEDSDDGAHSTKIQTVAQAGDITLSLPPTDGDAGEQLQTDGSGVMTWEAAGGTGTLYDAIGDPAAAGSISFDDGETATYTGANDAAVSFFNIVNSDGDHTGGNMYLLDLDYSGDDGDVDADFIKFQDSGSVVMTIQQDGEIATDGGITAGGTIEGATLTEGGQAVPNDTDHLGFFGGTTSAQLAAEISNETGTGVLVYATSPTLVTPTLGTINSGVGTALTALNGENIQNDTIDNDSIDWGDMTDLDTDGAVIWGNIAEGELANSTVIGADIKDDTVDSDDYAGGSIDDEHIADDSLQEPALNATNAGGAGIDNYVLSYNHAGTNFTWVVAGAGDMLKATYDSGISGGVDVLTTVDSTYASDYVLLTGTAVGTAAPKTDGGLTYDATSGTLSSTVLTEGGNAVWNATETDILDSGHYIAASIDYEHLATDVITGAAAIGAFESGDTFLIMEAGVGLREADYDDLPGVATAWDDISDPDAAATVDFVTYTQTIDIGVTDDGGPKSGLILDVTGLGAGITDVVALEITTAANEDDNYIPIAVYNDSGGDNDVFFKVDARGAVILGGGCQIYQTPITGNSIYFTDNSDTITFNYAGTDVDILWSDGVLNLRNEEDGVDAIVEIEGKDAGEKGILRVLSDGDDKNIELYHDDTDAHIISSSGDLHIEVVGGDINFADDNITTTGTATFAGGTLTGNIDVGGGDLELPQAAPGVPDADGEVELDFTDGKMVIQHGAAHAELGGATDIVMGSLIDSWSGTIFAPDGVNDVLTVKAINSIEFPHGVVITAIYLGVSSDTGYVLTVQNFDDFDTINAGNGTIDTVTYSADTTGEIIDTTPTYATIAAGQIIMISIPATDVDWIHFEIYYYEPAA